MGAFLLGILIGCAVFALVRAGQLTALKKQLADAMGRASHFERMSADLGRRLQAADREIAFLGRYRNIPNAEAHAQQLVAGAQEQAGRVVAQAETWATKVRDDVAHFSAVAAAMKNVVEGYGERFVVPQSSVLDDLAEGYGHAEAGAALKAAPAIKCRRWLDGRRMTAQVRHRDSSDKQSQILIGNSSIISDNSHE